MLDLYHACVLWASDSDYISVLQQAQYFSTGSFTDMTDWRHYALAAPMYTHFTSPIRRYPDIVVHRLLAKLLAESPGAATAKFSPCPIEAKQAADDGAGEESTVMIFCERGLFVCSLMSRLHLIEGFSVRGGFLHQQAFAEQNSHSSGLLTKAEEARTGSRFCWHVKPDKKELGALLHDLQCLSLALPADAGARRKARAAALIEALNSEEKQRDQSPQPTVNLALEFTDPSAVRPAHQINPEAGQSMGLGDSHTLRADSQQNFGFVLALRT